MILWLLFCNISTGMTIKVSHIITYNSKKYENIDANFCLQLGLISSCKLESTGVCGINLGFPGCISINHTWYMVEIEKSNIYPFLKYYMGWYIILFWEGVAVKIWSLGLVIVCLCLLLWCTLCKCLVTSMWGRWVQN